MNADDGGAPRVRSRWAVGLAGGSSLLILILAVGVVARAGEVGAPLSGNASEAESLRRENRALRMELELAATPTPYLVLDVPARTLTLKASGVVLRPFVFLSSETRGGGPQARRLDGVHAVDTIWSGGALLPHREKQRTVILSDSVTPPDPSGAVAYIPPTPEEETPTPPAFRLRFQNGFSVLVRVEGRGRWERAVNWFRLAPWRGDDLRVELTMSPEEAGALYRAFTPGTAALAMGAALAHPGAISGSGDPPGTGAPRTP